MSLIRYLGGWGWQRQYMELLSGDIKVNEIMAGKWIELPTGYGITSGPNRSNANRAMRYGNVKEELARNGVNEHNISVQPGTWCVRDICTMGE